MRVPFLAPIARAIRYAFEEHLPHALFATAGLCSVFLTLILVVATSPGCAAAETVLGEVTYLQADRLTFDASAPHALEALVAQGKLPRAQRAPNPDTGEPFTADELSAVVATIRSWETRLRNAEKRADIASSPQLVYPVIPEDPAGGVLR